MQAGTREHQNTNLVRSTKSTKEMKERGGQCWESGGHVRDGTIRSTSKDTRRLRITCMGWGCDEIQGWRESEGEMKASLSREKSFNPVCPKNIRILINTFLM